MKIFIPVYILLYALLLSSTLGILYIFKPYSYVDNSASSIICKKNNTQYNTGANLIYTFEDKLNHANDIKARMLCEYNTISAKNSSQETPLDINYSYEPKIVHESNWLKAFLPAGAVMLSGIIIIELLRFSLFKEKVPNLANNLMLASCLGGVIFFLLVKKPAVEIFCSRQTTVKEKSFKKAVFKPGVLTISEDEYIFSLRPQLYHSCIKSEYF